MVMRKDAKNIYLSGHGLRCPYCGDSCQGWTVIDAEYVLAGINTEAPTGAPGTTEVEGDHFVRWQCDGCGRKWEEILVDHRSMVDGGRIIDVREVVEDGKGGIDDEAAP